jgi:outer membrane lipoprotein-sorting protein
MKIKLVLVLWTLFLAGKIVGQSDDYHQIFDTVQIIQKISRVATEIETINSEFIQEKNITFLYETIISKGLLRYQKPDRLRLEYTSPFTYLLIMNEGQLLINTGESKTEYDLKSNKMFNQINDLIINSVQGEIVSNPDYKTLFYENADTLLVKLFPKQEELNKYIKNIDLYIGKDDFTVSTLQITEPTDDYTLIKFINKIINEPLPENSFSNN